MQILIGIEITQLEIQDPQILIMLERKEILAEIPEVILLLAVPPEVVVL